MRIAAPASAFSRPFRRALLIGCAAASLAGPAGTAYGQAINALPTTAFGAVTYDRGTPGVETIQVETDTAVIDWRPLAATPFLPAGNIATFTNGPNNTDFVVLNRIISGTPQRFDGTVLSILRDALGNTQTGGTVIFSSPGGLIIGGTAVFDVGSLVLTTLSVNVDGGGNFYDPATRGLNFSLAGPSPIITSLITEPGAQLNALQPNSYVALVGPIIQHGGATRVNGSAAYIAGEQVQFRANQGLFDIIVDVGSDNAVPLIHTGSTGGPASTGAGDNHAIYLVAMPKNQAITAVLSGDIGFDPAVSAGVENGVIVLSAGANIVGGAVDRYGDSTGTPAADLAANFEIRGGTVRSDLIGVARTNIHARPIGAPTLTFEQDVSLYGGLFAAISASTGQTVKVLGNAIVSAAAFESSDPGVIDLTGGQARIFVQDGGVINISGTATVDASARGLAGPGPTAGSGQGGSADVTASGGTITIDGALVILATGEGGTLDGAPLDNGGAGLGGTASLVANAGGTITANSIVGMNASGTASASGTGATVDGAAGTGGTVNVIGDGGGNVVIAGIFTAGANGAGGAVPAGPGLTGGLGAGGNINVRATDGNVDFNADASFLAAGGGGLGPSGGDGRGGDLVIEATRGTIDFLGRTNGAVGGFGGGAALPGGPGGDGQGGNILIAARSSDAASRISGGAFSLTAPGQGGAGANGILGTPAGDGGDGTGGGITIVADSDNGTIVLGALKLEADGLGGGGGAADNDVDGGGGGSGTGGEVLIGTTGGPVPGGGPAPTGSATFAAADLSARGTGGAGGFGAGSGGAGAGGTVGISAEGAPVTVTGATTLVANGQGSSGAGSPGGTVGTTGLATGGTVNILAVGHPDTGAPGTLTLGAVTGSADALGDGTGNVAGDWHVGAADGSTVTATNLALSAAAAGPGAGVPGASTLDPQNGTITVTGTAQLGSDGDILVNASQAGRIAGGRYELVAGGDITLNHATPVGGGFTLDVASLFAQAADDVTVGAGVVTRTTDITDIRALDLATVAGRILGREIRIGSADIDIQATGAIGDAATELVILDVDGGDNGPLPAAPPPGLGLGPAQFTVLGGTTQGPGYTLTTAEAGRIRAGTLRILVPALGTAPGRAPDLIVRDLAVNGGAAAGIGTLQIISPGIARVEGNLLMAGARPQDGLLLNARERLEVVTPTASVRVRDGTGAPGGALQLVSDNLWVASAGIIDLLRADPDYAGRDDDLIDNDGVDAPRGYIEGHAVTLTTRGTLYVQNTTAARGTFDSGSDFGGITTGAGGLTIVADVPDANVYAFGRRLNADGSFTTGDTFFYDSNYNTNAGANYTPVAALNTCIIVTGLCPRRVPPDTGVDGPDPFTGPTEGSIAIMLPANEEDDVIDSSFAADPLIEEPVTSGSETSLWNCDPDQDGDCDDQPQ